MEGVSPFFMEHHLQTTVIFLGDSHAILNQNFQLTMIFKSLLAVCRSLTVSPSCLLYSFPSFLMYFACFFLDCSLALESR